MRASSIVFLVFTSLFVADVAQAQDGPCNQEIMAVTKKLVTSDTVSGSPALASPPPDLHPGVAPIGEDAHDKAVLAQEVERRLRTKSDASLALEQAHNLDVQGKEAECMNEVMNAKQLAGL
jgi:hypothetical protein